MEFYFAPNGIAYLLPGLVVYALVCWKRPFTAVLVTVFGMKAVGDVLRGSPVEYWGLAVLGGATALSWARGEWRWNAAFFLMGTGLLLFMGYGQGIVYVHPDPLLLPMMYGVVIGFVIAGIRAVAFLARQLLRSSRKKAPPHPTGRDRQNS